MITGDIAVLLVAFGCMLLLAIFAIDDTWALIVFSLGLAIVSLLQGVRGISGSLLMTAREIFGAVLLGGALGLPAANLTGRVRPVAKESTGLEAGRLGWL